MTVGGVMCVTTSTVKIPPAASRVKRSVYLGVTCITLLLYDSFASLFVEHLRRSRFLIALRGKLMDQPLSSREIGPTPAGSSRVGGRTELSDVGRSRSNTASLHSDSFFPWADFPSTRSPGEISVLHLHACCWLLRRAKLGEGRPEECGVFE